MPRCCARTARWSTSGSRRRPCTSTCTHCSADGEITNDEIAEFIKDVTHHDAGPENVARVAAKLAAAGWPLAGINDA